MLELLLGRTVQGPDVADLLKALRADTLRLLVLLTALTYLSWHFLSIVSNPGLTDSWSLLANRWLLVPIVLSGLGVTWLCRRWVLLASFFFLETSTISLAAAVVLLRAPLAAFLLSLVALAATVLLRPLGGFLVSASALLLFDVGRIAGPLRILSGDTLAMAAAVVMLTVGVAWILDQNTILAVEWSQNSMLRAHRNEEEARQHRADLVQALHQLDDANYRLHQANAALETAWRAADAAERAKSEFVTNISHELRTPLNLIAGFSELIMTSPESYGSPLPPRYRSDVQAIYRSAQHLLALTSDVIDLARVGIGRLALTREPIDLAELVEDAVGMIKEYLAAKQLWLRVEIEPELPVLIADRLRIRQVLLNVLTNAARFTAEGGIAITVQQEKKGIVVKVSDTGPGIPLTEQQRIFEAFHQVEQVVRKSGERGYGLGLAISRRLIELHGGQIGADSRPGASTTFWFSPPSDAEAMHPSLEAERPADLSRLARRGDQILVMITEDKGLSSFFQRYVPEYRIVAADSPSAAALASELCALAILVDAGMSAATIAELSATEIPIICLPTPHTAFLAAALGVNACLTKPIRLEELRQAIEELSGPFRTVLIADDEPEFGQLIERYLRSLESTREARIFTAYTGAEALHYLKEELVDLLLLDLAMPEMDGQEVVRSMRTLPQQASVPVIVISARERSADYVSLPGTLSLHYSRGFGLEELLSILRGLLRTLPPPRPHISLN
jgi:signal transduction histidine kinase/CheY-like chemotaxis protein